MNRRHLLLAGAAAATGTALYATLVEPRWLEVVREPIHIRDLPPGLEGLRIALLTDLHAGGTSPHSVVRRAVRLAMRERPHLVAVTGDLASDRARGFGRVLREMEGLAAPLGVYAVPGNHDYSVGIRTWHRQVAAHPVLQDLTNRALVREVDGARLCIAGVDDLGHGTPSLDALPPPDERDCTILLAHDPEQAERARRRYDAVDLVLAGHTHGGQIRLPWIGPLATRSPSGEFDAGLRRRPWTQVYVSRGVGTVHLPVRFGCRPEVSLLTLTGRPRPAWR
jgi:uncharacterized protein